MTAGQVFPGTAEAIREALTYGAHSNSRAAIAALHLLLHAGIDLAEAVDRGAIEVSSRPDMDGAPVWSAAVADWPQLKRMVRPGSTKDLMDIAASFGASGGDALIKLYALVPTLKPFHARAVAEAFLICAGVNGWLTVVATESAPADLRYAPGGMLMVTQ